MARILHRLVKTIIIGLSIAMIGVALPAVIVLADTRPQTAIAVFGTMPDPETLPEGVSILSWSGHSAVFYGIDAKTSRELYAAGALMVFPIRQAGCLGLRKA